jgi:hypothetical protein
MRNPKFDRIEPTDRIIVTPEFERNWFGAGRSLDEYLLLEMTLLGGIAHGQIMTGPVPYVRLLEWPKNGRPGKKKVMYFYLNTVSPIILMNFLAHSDGHGVAMFDPESAAHFWEHVNHIVELLGSMVS